MDKRKIAIITGVSLILMAILAGFTFGYAYSEFYNINELDFLKNNIFQNLSLYKSMIFGIGFILILDLIVTYSLYKYFETDNKKISFYSAILRLLYTLIFGIALYFLIKNIEIDVLTNQMVISHFEHFQTIWNIGLSIFGLHIILLGFLIKLHLKVPKFLWILTLIAGVCYLVIHPLKLGNINSEMVKTLEMFFSLPMALGELGLALWLIIKGGKESKLK